jgi:hypothetical protein
MRYIVETKENGQWKQRGRSFATQTEATEYAKMFDEDGVVRSNVTRLRKVDAFKAMGL